MSAAGIPGWLPSSQPLSPSVVSFARGNAPLRDTLWSQHNKMVNRKYLIKGPLGLITLTLRRGHCSLQVTELCLEMKFTSMHRSNRPSAINFNYISGKCQLAGKRSYKTTNTQSDWTFPLISLLPKPGKGVEVAEDFSCSSEDAFSSQARLGRCSTDPRISQGPGSQSTYQEQAQWSQLLQDSSNPNVFWVL